MTHINSFPTEILRNIFKHFDVLGTIYPINEYHMQIVKDLGLEDSPREAPVLSELLKLDIPNTDMARYLVWTERFEVTFFSAYSVCTLWAAILVDIAFNDDWSSWTTDKLDCELKRLRNVRDALQIECDRRNEVVKKEREDEEREHRSKRQRERRRLRGLRNRVRMGA
ncbi:hypothetical protein PMZ80_005553 [Knufia obscura]|uniref:Uncharacterized protein n=2 Tax=Knufia TaxID=430999 RepID=A0AAN8EG76_9EURO|nr:hypothetical protein PMZ80_005553 [Knufia obscura]KAK5950022.1 hypothetical protein OHC33_008983 [Knufia fluminis]